MDTHGGHWETNVEKVLLSYAQPGMRVADIGAHFGYYTIKMGKKIGPNGYLYSFEPNPEMNKFVEENIKLNGLNFYAKLCKHALGENPGAATLAYSGGNLAQATLADYVNADTKVVVEVKQLDTVVSHPLDLVKLDAEGYEPFILKGATRTIQDAPDCALMMELNLSRWEMHSTIAELPKLVGETKLIFAVTAQGGLKPMPIDAISSFLQGCAFTENYFFFCPDNEQALTRIAPLVIR